MRLTLMVVVSGLTFACGQDAKAPYELPPFEPRLLAEFTIAAGADQAEPDSVARTSSYLQAGETLRGERYEVPGYTCLRADGTDWNALPAAATTPGQPNVIDVLYPPASSPADGPLVFMPHGNSFEFIESLGVTAAQKVPELAALYGIKQDGGTFQIEQATSFGARQQASPTTIGLTAVTLARHGATVIVPGDCWGDGGHSMGEMGAGYYEGRRLGGAFDHEAWRWAIDAVAHHPDREIAMTCSGGGHRTAEELIRDPSAFDAVVLESPADDTSGFLVPPLADLISAAQFALGDAVLRDDMNKFYDAIFAGYDHAATYSLGQALADGRVSLPVYLAYDPKDPSVPYPVIEKLVGVLTERGAPNAVRVFDDVGHCPLRTNADVADVLTWLTEVLGTF